jgi:hypothetical protein
MMSPLITVPSLILNQQADIAKTTEPSGLHRSKLYPSFGATLALTNITNTSQHLEMAKASAKEFAKMVLHDPQAVDAELLSTQSLLPADASPRKAVLSYPDSSDFSFAVAAEARQMG